MTDRDLWDPWLVEGASREVLLDLKLKVDEALQEIKAQIKEAETTFAVEGVRADPVWWRKVHGALRVHQQQSQRIQHALRELKALEREASREDHQEERKRFERQFVEVAKSLLPPETFRKIVEVANRNLEIL